MTKVEQLKAKAYVIEILEGQIERHEQTKESYRDQKPEDMGDWEIRELTQADEKIRMLEYVMDELAK